MKGRNEMIIEYEPKYEKEVKNLLVELQEYLAQIDVEKLNICTTRYREEYFQDTLKIMKKAEGKMYLEIENNEVIGLCVGIVNNLPEKKYDFQAPKRGRIKELIVKEAYRGKGYGSKLLEHTKAYLRSIGCEYILIAVLAYNENAKKLYEKNDFHARLIDMIGE